MRYVRWALVIITLAALALFLADVLGTFDVRHFDDAVQKEIDQMKAAK